LFGILGSAYFAFHVEAIIHIFLDYGALVSLEFDKTSGLLFFFALILHFLPLFEDFVGLGCKGGHGNDQLFLGIFLILEPLKIDVFKFPLFFEIL
jgi:hypothetical protein